MKIASLFALFAGFVLVTTGCASKKNDSSSDDENVQGGSESSETEANAESLSTSLVGGGSGTVNLASETDLSGSSGGLHFNNLGDKAKGFYMPAGCLVVTDEPAKKQATYAFTDCTGPYGLVHITGNVVIGYDSPSATELKLTYSATGLQINGATIDWNATADITISGNDYDMQWKGSFMGTTAKGRAIERTNTKDYKWTAGVACLAVTGTSDGTVTGRDLQTDVINFKRCLGACPEAGSDIKITDKTDNRVYDLTYGSGTATYTGPNGGMITFKPLCAY